MRYGRIGRRRDKVRGEYRVSSLMKQNKKAKICFVIYIAGFFLKKNSVMKCLRSKKRQNLLITTTGCNHPDVAASYNGIGNVYYSQGQYERASINQPFIVLTETKFSYRYIPVWARYSPHRTRVEAHANMHSPRPCRCTGDIPIPR